MKNKQFLPNYKDGSIVNLMSSIKLSFGKKAMYELLHDFDIQEIAKKNVLLLIIDGLGYKYLEKYGVGSFLHKNLKNKMTSVFPATTASAITTFMTGVAPRQHGLTGWFVYLKEAGLVSTILPFTSRAGNISLEDKIDFSGVYNQESFFENLEADCYSLRHKDYSESPYSLSSSKGAKRLAFSDMEDFFKQIEKTFKKGKKRKFMTAYWANFDSICHRAGTDSKNALKHFLELDEKIMKLHQSLKYTNTRIIVTADHGLINTKEKSKVIKLENHPKLAETLSMPLSGEPRVAYCYVKSEKIKDFERYVKTKLKNVCEMYKSQELVKKGYFGNFESGEKFEDRIGNYILIMKNKYIMKDLVLNEKQNIYIGNHGGVSEEEMFVPLVLI